MMRVMSRVNLTLDDDTQERLAQHAKYLGLPQAAAARELIREALARREARERRRRLASDYAAGRDDAKDLVGEIEMAQMELLDEESA